MDSPTVEFRLVDMISMIKFILRVSRGERYGHTRSRLRISPRQYNNSTRRDHSDSRIVRGMCASHSAVRSLAGRCRRPALPPCRAPTVVSTLLAYAQSHLSSRVVPETRYKVYTKIPERGRRKCSRSPGKFHMSLFVRHQPGLNRVP